MKKLSLFCFVALLIFFSACEKQNLSDGVSIRFINETDFLFDNIRIDDFNLGSVKKQKKIKYQKIDDRILFESYLHANDKKYWFILDTTTIRDTYQYWGTIISEGCYTVRIKDENETTQFYWENDN